MKNTIRKKDTLPAVQPELELLRLASRGVNTNLAPTESDFRYIVESIKSRKLVILFKWFWRHQDVDDFRDHFASEIDPHDLHFYINELLKILELQQDMHWIERINLFHIYGLSRLVQMDPDLVTENQLKLETLRKSEVRSLTDISEWNSILMIKNASSIDSLELLELIQKPDLLAEFGLYQLYYYQGLKILFRVLKDYLNTERNVIIPQTIAGLFQAEPKTLLLSNTFREQIYDEIILRLPCKVATKLERFDKKHVQPY